MRHMIKRNGSRMLAIMLTVILALTMAPVYADTPEAPPDIIEESLDSSPPLNTDSTPASEPMPMANATPLATPSNLSWDTGTPGSIKAKWDAVTDADYYQVTIFEKDHPTMLIRYDHVTATEMELYANLGTIKTYGTGKYSFQVQAFPVAGDPDHTSSALTEKSTEYSYTAVCKIGIGTYPGLDWAIDGITDSSARTITLLQTINHTQPIFIDNKKITLDLGSFALNLDTSGTPGSTALQVINGGKVSCSGEGKLNIISSQRGVRAEGGSEIHVSGNITAGQYGIETIGGSGNPKVTVDGDVTVTGQDASGEVEAISAGGYATVTIGGNVTANRTGEAQPVTAVYANGSTVTVGKNLTTQGSGVNVQNDGHVTIEGILNFTPTGAGPQSYIKVGSGAEGNKTADDFEPTSTRPGYKEYKNGANIVWVKGIPQLGKPAGLAWDTSAGGLKATWSTVPNANQYKVEYYKDGSKLSISTNVNPPSTSTDDMKTNLLVYGMGSYTFTVQATAAAGSGYLDSEVSAPSGPYSNAPGGTTYPVTVNGSYASPTGGGSYIPGDTVFIYAGNRTGYTFTGWTSSHVTITNAGSKDASFTMPNQAVTVTANWSYNGGGRGGGTSSAPSTSIYQADMKEGTGTKTTLPVTVNKNNGIAFADTGSGKLSSGETVVTMPSIPDVDTYSVGIPIPDLSTSDAQGTLTLQTDNGIVTVPSNMLTGASGISGSKAQISIGRGDRSTLPKDVKDTIGDRPLLQLTLSIDGERKDWSNPDTPVTVSIPYAPAKSELADPESIVIWYIDGSGNAICVPNGCYNSSAGTVIFTTTHFSYFAVSYNKASFSDVTAGTWYYKPVSFISARDITTGTGSGKFCPDAKLTRGQFIVMLMKAYEIAPDAKLKENFSDAGSTWYTGYLAAAKRLGISDGVGGNLFAPDKEITRQEMLTLLHNGLKAINELPQTTSGKALSDYSDASLVQPWAADSIALLVKAGAIKGTDGKLNPAGTATRAEMAQILYNLLSE